MKFILILFSYLLLTSCNMPTPAAQITGSYTSGMKYENYECDRLAIEINALARREDELTIAQEGRRKSSLIQALLLGFGTGDGVEASELAIVKGEKEAVRKAMDVKNCEK